VNTVTVIENKANSTAAAIKSHSSRRFKGRRSEDEGPDEGGEGVLGNVVSDHRGRRGAWRRKAARS